MDSSGTKGGGYDPEGPCGRTNAGEGTLGTVGAGVPANGCGPGTWTFLASKA
jgi:hypothetical protein